MNNYRFDVKKRFGKAVRERRLILGVSQEKFAEVSGLHRTYIGDVERGLRNVSLENIVKIAKALRISMSDLFSDFDR